MTNWVQIGQPVSALSGDVPGRMASHTTKTAIMNTPMANSGMEAQTDEKTDTARSIGLRSRMPASTPSTIEKGTINAKLTAASRSVLPKRSQRTSVAGR